MFAKHTDIRIGVTVELYYARTYRFRKIVWMSDIGREICADMFVLLTV